MAIQQTTVTIPPRPSSRCVRGARPTHVDHVGVRIRRGVDLGEVDLAHDREVKRDVRHLG